jgi:hypothetical protein
MNNMFYNITGETTVLDDDLTIHTTHEIVNTTIYDVARREFKKMSKRHDHVVFVSQDFDVPHWSATAIGGNNPHIVLEEEVAA